MKLSVILPGIRPQNWQKLYDSIDKAVNRRYSWELVAIGPEGIDLNAYSGSYKFIEDRGSPCHCQQRVLLTCAGEYVTWAADDGEFLPNALNHDFDVDAIFCKYVEGSPNLNDTIWQTSSKHKEIVPYMKGDVGTHPGMVEDYFWTIQSHTAAMTQYIPNNWLVLSLGIIKRELLLELGGWDTENFETCSMASPDLGVRIQRFGIKPILWNHVIQANSWIEGHAGEGDRSMHFAHVENDAPAYQKIHSDSNSVLRTKILINKEDNLPSIWKRKYK